MGREDVRKAVESADCVLILGAFMTDINLGIYTAQLEVSRSINAISAGVSIKHHINRDVKLKHFIDSPTKAKLGPKKKVKTARRSVPNPSKPRKDAALTVARFFDRMNHYLGERTMVISDIGDSLFGAADLTIQKRTEFLSPAYYTSMGFAIPAALGAQMRKRHLRPIVFVGDGAFRMTGQELSTIARHGLNPIIFVLNIKGYSTERFINDGPYNSIHDWAYHKWPELLQAGWGAEARTEGELEQALTQATKNTKSLSIINLRLDPYDRSLAMERLGKRLGERVNAKK